MRFVAAFDAHGKLTIHLPENDDTENAFCGMMHVDEKHLPDYHQANVPPGAVSNCQECFNLWRVAQRYSRQDFEGVRE